MILSIKNIKISVSVYFAALVTFACVFAPDGTALLGILCCALHETGHLILIKLFGGNVKGVFFGAYGMRIETAQNMGISHKKEAAISFGGPFVNIILGTVGLIFGFNRLLFVNAALAVLNLIPIEKTDGWSILYNIFISEIEEEKVKAVLKIISTAFLFLFYFFGFAVLVKSGFNFSLLAVAVYLTVMYVKN